MKFAIRPRLAMSLLAASLAGCMATQGTVVTPEGSKDSGFKMPWTSREESASVPPPPPPPDSAKMSQTVSRTTVEVQCKTPAENYDFGTAIGQRFGAEGKARMERLLTTDFATASLTPKDREMLRFMSTEMLWIPVPVEEKIGSALLIASSRDMTVLERDGNAEFWTKTVTMVRNLSATAPPNPFELRLILLQKGSPGSLAGGVIFIDNATLKSVFDDDSAEAEEKLRFVIAHEMAHIYKRHRAKRIQQVLVDSDAGLKLMRQIIARGQSRGSGSTVAAFQEWIQTASAVPQVAEDLMKKHEKYGKDQEFEADACATAMMMNGNLGNPLRAFRGYAKDAARLEKAGQAGVPGSNAMIGASLIETHPPIPARESNIDQKMKDLVTTSAPPKAAATAPSTPAPATGSRTRTRAPTTRTPGATP